MWNWIYLVLVIVLVFILIMLFTGSKKTVESFQDPLVCPEDSVYKTDDMGEETCVCNVGQYDRERNECY